MSAAFGGGSQKSQGQQQSTETSHRGLDPAQSADLSKYVGPGLMDLYNQETAKLGLGSTTPSTSKWIVPPGGTASGYSGQVPAGYQLMPGQAGMSGNYIMNPSASSGAPSGYLDTQTGQTLTLSQAMSQGFDPNGPTQARFVAQSGASGAAGAPSYYNATSGQISDQPSQLQTTPGTTTPSGQQPFQLPGLDQNGMYAGQTGAVEGLLSKAYGGLGIGDRYNTGAGTDLVTSMLPQLMNMAGNQTLAGAFVPEQVRQQRVANVNSVLQLMAAGLGGASAGQGTRSSSGSGFQFEAKGSFGKQQTANEGAA